MSMVCGLDLHRGQITFDILETVSGVEWRGRLWRPDRARFRRWLLDDLGSRAGGCPVEVAFEGCTGWRFVVEEIEAAGFVAHVAEPADTQAARGRKKRAKTDRSGRGLRHPRRLLATIAGLGAWDRPTHTSPGLCGLLLPVSCTPAFVLDGLETLTRPHLPAGDTQSRLLSPTTTPFVEHLGNAGRPHRPRRPITSLHQPSGWSRSYVLASLRALHLDQHRSACDERCQLDEVMVVTPGGERLPGGR